MRRGTYRISTTESRHREVNVQSADPCVQLFGGRRRLRLVPFATALVLVGAASAGAANPAKNRLISPQYRAKSGDTATMAGVAVLSGLTAPRAGPHSGSTTYRTQNMRYQLQNDSILRSVQLPGYRVSWERATSASIPRYNRLQIAPQIRRSDPVTQEPRAISSEDARLLLRLGLGLGLMYIIFLAAWFWRTRNRTKGAAARVVRF
jgi:hypothetical protein